MSKILILFLFWTFLTASVSFKPNNPTTNALNLKKDTSMVELIKLDKDFVLDIRYATANNFTGKVLYDCPRAFLRKEVAKDFLQAHKEFKKLGYVIKIYDAYRPLSVQWRLWNNTPDKNYVADPKKGSMHNRGCAIDMSLVDAKTKKELDMGTEYDFFGIEAHISHEPKLSAQVQQNRKMMREVMAKYGFTMIKTEWWHFSYKRTYPVSDTPIPCQ